MRLFRSAFSTMSSRAGTVDDCAEGGAVRMAALSPAGARGAVPPRCSDGVIQPQLLGGAHALWIDGNLEAGRDRFDAAYRVAELEQDPTAMALAAIGLGGLWAEEHRGVVASTRLEMRLRRALAGLEPRSPLALRIRTRLAAEQDHREGKHARIIAILREARRSDDSTARSEASNLAHHCLLGPDHNAVRHRLASDLIVGSVSTGRRSDLLMGVMWRAVDLFLDGASGAERGLEELRQLLASGNHLAVAHVADAIDVMLSVRAGRLHIAETQAASCAEHGQAAGAPDSISWHAAQLMSIRWFQGRTTELLPMLRDAVNSPALTTVDRSLLAALAVAAATAGETREAAGAVARLVGEGISAAEIQQLASDDAWSGGGCLPASRRGARRSRSQGARALFALAGHGEPWCCMLRIRVPCPGRCLVDLPGCRSGGAPSTSRNP